MQKIFKAGLFLPLLVWLSFLGSLAQARDYTIAIAISSDLKEYNQAYSGIIYCPDWKGVNARIHPIYFDPNNKIESSLKLVKLQPDLIFTIGSRATKSVTNLVKDIPIVHCMVFDKQLIEELKENDYPNVFGVDSYFSPSVQLEALKKILPNRMRIGILYDPKNSRNYIEEVFLKAKEFNMSLVIREVSSESNVLPLLESIKKDVDVLLSIPDKTIYTPLTMKSILLFSLRNKIPVVGFSSSNVSSGALFSLLCDYSDLGSQAVKLAISILQGKKFHKGYLEEPRKQLLALNMRTANVIDIKLPDEIIGQAMMIFGVEDSR
ncbi:MAG: ABC transporter substrate-binding protein [Acidobacteriota bacterium]